MRLGLLRRGLRFGLLGLLVAGATLTLAASSPASSGTLDQQQTNAPNDGIEMNGTLATAQVFTPTLSGQLGQVDVLLNRVDTPLGPLSVQIWATASGVPSSPITGASATVQIADIPTGTNWVQVPISAPSVAGTQYAIVLSDPSETGSDCQPPGLPDSNTACLYWMADDSNPYPDPSYISTDSGGTWVGQARDMNFKTYVVPPPCTQTGFYRDGIDLTAKQIGGNVTGTLDASGCNIGVYYGPGTTGTVSGTISGANYYGVVADRASVNVTGATIHDIGETQPSGAQHGVGVLYTTIELTSDPSNTHSTVAGHATGTLSGSSITNCGSRRERFCLRRCAVRCSRAWRGRAGGDGG